LTEKCFSLTGKCSPLTGKYSPLTGKCFPLTNFPNDKQTQESLKSDFPESEFQETNMALMSFSIPMGNRAFPDAQTLCEVEKKSTSTMHGIKVKSTRLIAILFIVKTPLYVLDQERRPVLN